jgi:threonine dehydrogenase-like Zn-dependent dehydrogenase
VAIDCSGAPAGQNLALDAAAKRGAVAFVGESRATQINPSDQIIRKLLTVVGGWYFPLGEWGEISRLVVDKQLPVENLVTHRFSIEDAAEAFRAFDQRETEKAVFLWQD